MQVATSFAEAALAQPALLTIGTFDGVHRGHRFLLEQAQQRALEHGYGMVIVTFDPCPAIVLRPAVGRYQLTTAAQKLRLLKAFDPALVVILPFSRELALRTADEFMAALEERLTLREMWLGEDFHFGKDRAGGLTTLIERGRMSGFALHVVARRTEDQASISSTRVRQALTAGKVQEALPLLGRPYALELLPESVEAHTTAAGQAIAATVEAHLALPTDGPYAVLCSTAETPPEPAVALVRSAADTHQLEVWPTANTAGITTVEFILPLFTAAEAHGTREALLASARRFLDTWERPSYPASGSH